MLLDATRFDGRDAKSRGDKHQTRRGKNHGRAENIEEPAKGRADNRCRLPGGCAPRNRIAESLARNESRHKRLRCRVREGTRDAKQDCEGINRIQRRRTNQCASQQTGGNKGNDAVTDDRDQAAIKAVRDMTADKRHQQNGKKRGQPDQTQCKRALR